MNYHAAVWLVEAESYSNKHKRVNNKHKSYTSFTDVETAVET